MTVQLVLLIVALFLAAFAASAETSLTTVSKLRMRTLAEEGNRGARRIVRLHADPNAYLSTILTVNTVALILASQAAVLLAAERFPRLPEFVITIVLSVIALVACEILPKSLALRFNEPVALTLARPVGWLVGVLRPVVGALTWVSKVIVRAATRDRDVRGPFVTEAELKMLVSVSEQEGVVEQEERQMIHGVLELTDKVAREVMVPRVDVAALEAGSSVEDLVALIIETGHSRIPVYETTIDNVVGIVYAKDVLRPLAEPGVTLRSIAREPYFTPEAKRAGELLHDMQARKVHIAIVVDEYGGTAGLVTIEDLIEEIVGEIRDEYDLTEPEEVQFLSDNEALVSGRLGLTDANELLHLDIDTGEVDADSIGGFVYEQLGEIPKPGATFTVGDTTFTVESVRRQSISSVRIRSAHPFSDERNGRREPREEAAEADSRASIATRGSTEDAAEG